MPLQIPFNFHVNFPSPLPLISNPLSAYPSPTFNF